MNHHPTWLPNIINCNGNWSRVVQCLYQVFVQDFKLGNPTIDGQPVFFDNRKIQGGPYEEGFWHLISRLDKTTNTRIPDFRRAERLPWCAPTLNNTTDPAVVRWDYREGNGKVRTYVWLIDFDYVVILEKKVKPQIVYGLITAYHIDGPTVRQKFAGKYKKRLP